MRKFWNPSIKPAVVLFKKNNKTKHTECKRKGVGCKLVELYFQGVCASVAAMPSVMERSGAGVLSRSRAKTVTNGNSQPHSEEESSDEEHAHGRETHKPEKQLSDSNLNSFLCLRSGSV